MALIKKTAGNNDPTPSPSPSVEKSHPQYRPQPKAKPTPKDDLLAICLPLEVEGPNTPPQRGTISPGRANLLKLQLWLADNLRKSIAPGVPLDLPLERTPEKEQLVRQRFGQVLKRANIKIPPNISRETFFSNVLDEIFGYGPIEPLIRIDEITEIMVNGPYIIFIESNGKLVESGHKFLDDDHVERIVKRVVKPLGRVADQDNPLIDARLPDGSRVNAVIRPCAIDGPNLTIRKFSRDKLTIQDLLNFGSISGNMSAFLEAAVVSRQNIIVSGGTGSGKTTLINVLSGFIPGHERTVTIEDAAELQFKQRNVVRLETKKPTPDSPTMVSIRDCVVNALRMRPERIVVGECRSGEALDMLQAMNTGHDGSMTTIHANSPRDCISRLETLVLMAGVDLPLSVVRKQIASAIHLIVQAARLRDGSRKVTKITEVQGMEGETVVLTDIFKYIDRGDGADGNIAGQHEASGIRPNCVKYFKQYGFELPHAVFMS